MKSYTITVNGTAYEVTVEETGSYPHLQQLRKQHLRLHLQQLRKQQLLQPAPAQ